MARTLIAALALAALGACGGGGSDTAATTDPATTFPLAAAYKAFSLRANGTNTYAVTGSCGGTASQSFGAVVSSSFEGQAANSQQATSQVNLTGCTPATSTDTQTGYLDPTTGLTLGVVATGAYYKTTSLTPLAASAVVGTSGNALVMTRYADSTKATVTGSETFSYVVGAGDATSARLTITSRIANAAGAVEVTQLSVYRLGTDGSLESLSVDVLQSNGIHLVLTRT